MCVCVCVCVCVCERDMKEGGGKGSYCYIKYMLKRIEKNSQVTVETITHPSSTFTSYPSLPFPFPLVSPSVLSPITLLFQVTLLLPLPLVSPLPLCFLSPPPPPPSASFNSQELLQWRWGCWGTLCDRCNPATSYPPLCMAFGLTKGGSSTCSHRTQGWWAGLWRVGQELLYPVCCHSYLIECQCSWEVTIYPVQCTRSTYVLISTNEQ